MWEAKSSRSFFGGKWVVRAGIKLSSYSTYREYELSKLQQEDRMARLGQAQPWSPILHVQEESGTTLEISTPQLSWQIEIIVREGGKKVHLMHYAPGLSHSGDRWWLFTRLTYSWPLKLGEAGWRQNLTNELFISTPPDLRRKIPILRHS